MSVLEPSRLEQKGIWLSFVYCEWVDFEMQYLVHCLETVSPQVYHYLMLDHSPFRLRMREGLIRFFLFIIPFWSIHKYHIKTEYDNKEGRREIRLILNYSNIPFQVYEDGGTIKAYNNHMEGSYTFIPYGASKYMVKGKETAVGDILHW